MIFPFGSYGVRLSSIYSPPITIVVGTSKKISVMGVESALGVTNGMGPARAEHAFCDGSFNVRCAARFGTSDNKRMHVRGPAKSIQHDFQPRRRAERQQRIPVKGFLPRISPLTNGLAPLCLLL